MHSSLAGSIYNIAPVWADMDTVLESLFIKSRSMARTEIVAADEEAIMPYKDLYDGSFIIAKRNSEARHPEKTILEVSNRSNNNDYLNRKEESPN